ncbi:ankyrin repeat protein [Dictyocaulus viviparus]|uniref:Ankyrin repeat protein n=1 Tax=Dictyocaulus viviparus TaxID=29172 RepID=A0A0D8Y8N3_DICVI|nr:ankyrin repeat protein [Dictyocaulus viviparus]
MAASFMDHWEIVDLLLDHGANIYEIDSAGATALHLALSNGSKTEAHDKTIQTLIKRGSDLTLADAHGRVCLHLAAYYGDQNLESLIGHTCIDIQDALGRTPLMLAASQGQLKAVDQLIKHGEAKITSRLLYFPLLDNKSKPTNLNQRFPIFITRNFYRTLECAFYLNSLSIFVSQLSSVALFNYAKPVLI